MSPRGYNKYASFSKHSVSGPSLQIPEYPVKDSRIGLAYDVANETVLRFSCEEEIRDPQRVLFVIRDSEGNFKDPKSYLDCFGVTRRKLDKALCLCGGLTVAHIEKLIEKQKRRRAIRPTSGGKTIVRQRITVAA